MKWATVPCATASCKPSAAATSSAEIARSAYEYQQRIESGRQVIVGLNQYQSESQQKLELFQFDPEEEEWQKGRLAEARSKRSVGRCPRRPFRAETGREG